MVDDGCAVLPSYVSKKGMKDVEWSTEGPWFLPVGERHSMDKEATLSSKASCCIP